MEQGILQPQQVEELQKELALDEFNTISGGTGAKASSFAESVERIAVFGRYVQLEFLGLGGMARVYKAYDPSLARNVALKFVKVEDPQYAHRLLQEARSQARIEHEHVCKIYETGEAEGKPYIAMQFISGQTLKQLNESLSLRQKVELIRQVADGVHAAHKAGLIHRDLKPANILIEQRETGPVAYVMDFGLARETQAAALTMTGLIVGTPSYMPPEQARGQTDKIDARTDIYSIGATLYESITGRPPFEGASTTDILMQIVEKDPVLPRKLQSSLPMDLQTIVLKCMDKNPDRRYASARSLSEDLSRFLDGDPIQATPDTWMYRTNKRIRKHPLIAGLLAAAFLAVCVLAAMAGLVQWRAEEQAKLFQEFGVEVTGIQAVMRYAYLLPLHDVQGEKAQITQRLEHIKTRMKTLGKLSYAPGNYSLGKGYLSLHRYQAAYDHLFQAWEKYNYREPEVANALGLSLAMLYQEKLREAEQTNSKEQLKQRKEELGKQYRAPALQYIQHGSSASEAPEYVTALILFLEHKYPEALEKSEAAMHRVSWFYEAQMLQGDIFTEMANNHKEIGKTEAAGNYFDSAKTAYLEAAKKGQSDPEVYTALCAVQASIQEMQLDEKGSSSETIVKEGISSCEKALKADSRNINANLYSAKIYTDFAYSQYLHGIDCAPATERAADFARAVLKMEPENGLAHQAIGNAYKTLAGAESEKGGNPTRFLDIANVSFAKALQKMPNNPELLSNSGANYINQALYENGAGKDPIPSIKRAVDLLNQAVELSPRNAKYRCNLGIAYCRRGVYEKSFGVDPRSSFEQSAIQSKKSVEINPSYVSAYIWAAVAYAELAYFQRDHRGENPIPATDEAIKMHRKTLTLDPENAYSHNGLGACYLIRARELLKESKDPAPEIQAARESYQKSLSLNDQNMTTYMGMAEVELQAATIALQRKESAEVFLDQADRILRAGLSISPDSYECLQSFAFLHLMRAEHLYLLRQSAEREIRTGIEACDRSLKGNSENAVVHAYRAKFFLLRARSLSGSSSRMAAKEAVASYDEAFRLAGFFRKEYGADREEAQHLSQ